MSPSDGRSRPLCIDEPAVRIWRRFCLIAPRGNRMPQATLRIDVDGREETISEYICDWPDCPDPGIHAFALPGLRQRAVVCTVHAALIAQRGNG